MKQFSKTAFFSYSVCFVAGVTTTVGILTFHLSRDFSAVWGAGLYLSKTVDKSGGVP